MKYQKKSVEIHAICYDRNNLEAVKAFAGNALIMRESLPAVKSLEGEEILNVGDWVVRNPGGEFYVTPGYKFYDHNDHVEGDRYLKKSVLQEAIRFTGGNFPEIVDFGATVTPPRKAYDYDAERGECKIPHPGFPNPYTAHVGDYIVRNGNSVYPCNANVFEQTYEPVEAE